MKTAKALGLKIPMHLRQIADQIIDDVRAESYEGLFINGWLPPTLKFGAPEQPN